MDDTLYWERDYVSEFIKEIKNRVFLEKGESQADQFSLFFTENWARGDRKEIFQRSINQFHLETIAVSDFLNSMRSLVIPKGLELRTWAKTVLGEFDGPTAVLTNGDQATQRNKFAQLFPASLLEDVELVLAKDYEPKPSGLGARAVIEKWKMSPSEILFVGDSPLDKKCAEEVGCYYLSSIC
jgi:FMN phosphatase YigB (HAD superfamily)